MSLIASFNGSTEIVKLVLGSMIWAEIIGVPVAWIKLRGTQEWANRPRDVGCLDLLARFVGKITAMVGIWALVIVIGAIVGSAMS